MVGGIVGYIKYSGGDDGYNFHDEILQWTGDDWVEVGKMKMARSDHAVSTITMDDDAMQFCK